MCIHLHAAQHETAISEQACHAEDSLKKQTGEIAIIAQYDHHVHPISETEGFQQTQSTLAIWQVLLCDEPTSGLDSAAASNMVVSWPKSPWTAVM